MNKQELIDKVVREWDGKYPATHHESHCVYTDGFKFLLGIVSDTDRDIVKINQWKYVCNKSEFQQRAKELGYGGCGVSSIKESLTDDWWDYESQKAIKLPPVGAECEYVGCVEFAKVRNDWFPGQKLKVLCYESVEGNSVAVVFNVDAESAQCLVKQCMRPKDWNRKAEQERKKCIAAVRDAFYDFGGERFSTFEKLYNAGFLKLPEQKDEK